MLATFFKMYVSFLVIVLSAIAVSLLLSGMFIARPVAAQQQLGVAQGSWELINENAGIASMHAAVTRFSNVVMLDRTNIGASRINLTAGKCREAPMELTLKHDCTAHSVLFTPGPNSVRALMIETDTWCSSGQFIADGTLVQTGGDFEGLMKVRRFAPCPEYEGCDWLELANQSLQMGRWYSTNQLLPDGLTQIIVGGRNVFTFEFFPNPASSPPTFLPFLQQTNDPQGDNLYPFVHLLPDGTLFIFANRDSIILNYTSNQVLKSFPSIPGEPRNYPSAGSSVMLPLQAQYDFNNVEILVCGGAQFGAFLNSTEFLPASQTCGRIQIFSNDSSWEMEMMPFRRTMGDMLLLPTEDVLIINGAQNGCQGWGFANNPTLYPLLYHPTMPTGERFAIMAPTTIPRLYHSTANLLPDGRILVAGSNTHQYYTFTGDFPTELRVEAFLPDYLNSAYNSIRPTILQAPEGINYNETFVVRVAINTAPSQNVKLSLMSAPFNTHSFSQGQRLLSLNVEAPSVGGENVYVITATAPPRPTLAPPSYYMLFAVNNGIPSYTAKWVSLYASS